MTFKIQTRIERRARPLHMQGRTVLHQLQLFTEALTRSGRGTFNMVQRPAEAGNRQVPSTTQPMPVQHTRTAPGTLPAAMPVPAMVTPASSALPAPSATGTNSFANLVHQVSMRKVHPIDAIRAGMPAALLRDASTYFNLPAQRINTIARVPNTTAHNWSRQNANMDAAASERIWRMADVAALAREVFGTEEAAKSWLGAANRTFQNSAPLDYLDTEPGAAAVRQVLNAIATGGAA